MRAVGETLTHYRIETLLGEGGMGKVFLAEDIILGRKVALKFPSDSLKQDPSGGSPFPKRS
jgi:eukaryotic-like serine/threonine-protein kinase